MFDDIKDQGETIMLEQMVPGYSKEVFSLLIGCLTDQAEYRKEEEFKIINSLIKIL